MKNLIIVCLVVGMTSVAGAGLTFDFPQTVVPGEAVTVTVGSDTDITVGVGDLKFVASNGTDAVVTDLAQGPLATPPWSTIFIDYPIISVTYQNNGFGNYNEINSNTLIGVFNSSIS